MIVLFISIFLNIISCEADCKLNLEDIAVSTYSIDTDFNSIEDLSSAKVEQSDNRKIANFSKNHSILNRDLLVEYELTFQNNKLTRYKFVINMNKKEALPFFYKLTPILKKKNEFMKGDKISYGHTIQACKKFIRFESGFSNDIIKGGVFKLE